MKALEGETNGASPDGEIQATAVVVPEVDKHGHAGTARHRRSTFLLQAGPTLLPFGPVDGHVPAEQTNQEVVVVRHLIV